MKLYTIYGRQCLNPKRLGEPCTEDAWHYVLAVHDYEARCSFKKEYPDMTICDVIESEKHYNPDGTEYIARSLACPLPFNPDKYVM